MPNKKKENPRDVLIIFRTSKKEEKLLKEEAKDKGYSKAKDWSKFLRFKMGLTEENA